MKRSGEWKWGGEYSCRCPRSRCRWWIKAKNAFKNSTCFRFFFERVPHISLPPIEVGPPVYLFFVNFLWSCETWRLLASLFCASKLGPRKISIEVDMFNISIFRLRLAIKNPVAQTGWTPMCHKKKEHSFNFLLTLRSYRTQQSYSTLPCQRLW